MKVLVLGAGGFIGSHLVAALEMAGHGVVRGVSRAARPGEVAIDFAHATTPEDWRAHLAGVGAVVNAVGILRGSRARPMRAVHAQAPAALFEACAEAGVRRVLHVSAIGIDASDTPYATSKREAEGALLGLNAAGRLDGVVVRPSIVFGAGGESTTLFVALSRLPVVVLPEAAIRARVQPVHVLELAQAVARLVENDTRGGVELVGPRDVRLAGLIASLRRQGGRRPARVIGLPDGLTRLSAALADVVPVTPWGRQALALLSQDNVGDPAPLAALLGRAATDYEHLLAMQAPD